MTRQKPIVVAIGFGEALSAPEVAWSLIDAGFQVISFSRKGKRPALSQSRYVKVREIAAPEESWNRSREDLSAFLAETAYSALDQKVILPLDDAALWLVNGCSFADRWVIAGPQGDNARLALEKEKQIDLAQLAGFQVPESHIVKTSDELLKHAVQFPLILRPAEAASLHATRNQKGSNWICADVNELNRAIEAWKGRYPLLLQPYLQGVGEGIFGLATADRIVALSGHRRLRMMNPHGSGSSACISQVVADNIRKCCESFVKLSNWRGLFMIETLRDASGQSWFVEFNGRAWGSMALARRQHLDYPTWSVKDALGHPISYSETTRQSWTCRNLGRELMHLIFIARGPQTRAIPHWPSFWKSLRDVIRFDTRSSFYNWRRDDWKVFVYDCWSTLRDQVRKSTAATRG